MRQKQIRDYVLEARLAKEHKNEDTHKENDWSNLKPLFQKVSKSLNTISYTDGRKATATIGWCCNVLIPLQQYVNSIYQEKQDYIDAYTKKDFDAWLTKARQAADKL